MLKTQVDEYSKRYFFYVHHRRYKGEEVFYMFYIFTDFFLLEVAYSSPKQDKDQGYNGKVSKWGQN